MILQLAAAGLLVVLLWSLFRLAMGLRWAKLSREQARQAEETRGRRVVAEIPAGEGDLTLFLEDDRGFYWGAVEVRKPDVAGARLLLNGGVIGSFSRGGWALPEPPSPEEFEGRERWDVILYLRDGRRPLVPCGWLREGVSREIAARVFEAVRASAARPGRLEDGAA
jgi:hypothetical protein